MTKDVSVQELQEHLAEHLEEVKRGVTLRVMEGENAVAEVAPAEFAPTRTPDALIFRRARGSFADFVPPPPIEADIDVVALLREDRDAR